MSRAFDVSELVFAACGCRDGQLKRTKGKRGKKGKKRERTEENVDEQALENVKRFARKSTANVASIFEVLFHQVFATKGVDVLILERALALSDLLVCRSKTFRRLATSHDSLQVLLSAFHGSMRSRKRSMVMATLLDWNHKYNHPQVEFPHLQRCCSLFPSNAAVHQRALPQRPQKRKKVEDKLTLEDVEENITVAENCLRLLSKDSKWAYHSCSGGGSQSESDSGSHSESESDSDSDSDDEQGWAVTLAPLAALHAEEEDDQVQRISVVMNNLDDAVRVMEKSHLPVVRRIISGAKSTSKTKSESAKQEEHERAIDLHHRMTLVLRKHEELTSLGSIK